MREPERKIRIAAVTAAQRPSPWELGNDTLYRLCRECPTHENRGHVASKVWLIGRSYSASIERHMNSTLNGEDFVAREVAPRLMWPHLDHWLSRLPRTKRAFADCAEETVRIHKAVLDRMAPVLTRQPHSFVSKYLHFHQPDVFPIYDSRASTAIRAVTPDARFVPKVESKTADPAYRDFCARLRWLANYIEQRWSVTLTLRELDNLLMNEFRSLGKRKVQ